jgi:hypothetical protein
VRTNYERKIMKDRITKAKEYMKEHAPQIITATAAVVLVGLTLKTRKDVRVYLTSMNENRLEMQWAIPEMIKTERPFTYYPGIGAFWDAPLPPE